MKGDRYPRASAALERLMQAAPEAPAAPLSPFAIGPAVLRQPPVRVSSTAPPPLDQEPASPTDELLGELVDMVFVSADDAQGNGKPEVHLVFKAEVLGGLHLKLVRMPEGLHAIFMVDDGAARRAVAAHVDDLVRHLRDRGFSVSHHAIEVAAP